ncbi:substrate-binding periplasmic protein [Rhodoligotrophos defluvii]|uniref:substrate-binding periplasmic protein n=1 Tax=Rhodoligotrophos defluvii TaxID=2561934 RepID=UPI0019614674|nr:transporter substrate-binding domain-containing protein [Rhodoligotrophos defluvii]
MAMTRWMKGLGALMVIAGLAGSPAWADPTDVPAPGQSKKIDAIKERGTLRVAAIGEFPWLPENTTGSGEQYSGPAWLLAKEYAKRLGVELQVVPVSHETKVPILATGEADISIAPLAVTPAREKVVDFIVYSRSSLCFVGLADNPKIKDAKTVDDLDKKGLVYAFFTGTPPETWAPTRFENVEFRAVAGSGANAPIEEILSKRADFTSVDNVAWPKLNASVKGLMVVPLGDDCLKSNEMATGVGLAVGKSDPKFRDWLQAVHDSIKDQVEAEEIKLLKAGS